MIYKCMNCSSALLFKPRSGMLECDACGSAFWASQFKEETECKEEMQMEFYSCTACGAQVAVSDVEVSTFCAYCGQPTVVFDRVSAMKRPEYIIPFSVSKEKSVQLIREHIGKSSFVPKEIMNFEVERVRGIYIPFWLYDVKYYGIRFFEGEVYSHVHINNERKLYFMREAEVTFHNLTLDASKKLDSSVTQRLEPFDTKGMIPFHSAYLSGFYADCYGYKADELENYVLYRCKKLFDEEIEKTINIVDFKVEAKYGGYDIIDKKYAMLPAWFVTFRYNDRPYTVLVNGQTQKVVGAVPYSKKMVRWSLLATTLKCMLIIFPIIYFCCWLSIKGGLSIWEYIVLAIIVLTAVCLGRDDSRKLDDGIDRSVRATTNKFVMDRQEG